MNYRGESVEYDENQMSALVKVILQDDLTQVEELLAEGAIVNPDNLDESSPLVAAMYRAFCNEA